MNDAAGVDVLAGHLLPGEGVVWSGRPQQGFMLTSGDGFAIPFSLVWGGLIVCFEVGALRQDNGLFALVALPFALVGLYIIAGRFAFDAWLRSRTIYALTDRRVLILRKAPWPSFISLGLAGLPKSTLYDMANGRGTIRFGTAPLVPDGEGGWKHASSWTPALHPTPRFLGIEEARTVLTAIERRARR